MMTLETDRLKLRMFREDDFEEYARITSDEQVTRYLSDGRPLARWEAWRQMAMIIGHWHLKEEFRNVSAVSFWPEPIDEARSPILSIVDDDLTGVNDELIIKASSNIVEVRIDEPIHSSLDRINNFRNASGE